MHFSSASSWKMLSSSGEFVFQSAWKGTLRLSRDSDTLILSASSRPFLTRYLRRLEKGESRDSRWLPREGEKLPFFFFQRNSARCARFDSAAWSYSFILSALLRRITKRNVRFFGGTTPAARHPLSVVRSIFASVEFLPESVSLFVSSRACLV